jgi:mRNA-degrading endonuclease RelE of RelBE toxin-antitoxin system
MGSYRVDVTDDARREIRQLPGNLRQRAVRLLRSLEQEPRPESSRPLDVAKAGIDLGPGAELRRVRLASWRVVYLVEDDTALVSVLAIRKRPPYQYDDLEELIRGT